MVPKISLASSSALRTLAWRPSDVELEPLIWGERVEEDVGRGVHFFLKMQSAKKCVLVRVQRGGPCCRFFPFCILEYETGKRRARYKVTGQTWVCGYIPWRSKK